MQIQKNISLKPYNTFGIDVKAKRFVAITSTVELQELLKTEKDIFVLSGGSNVLLTKDIDKLVVHLNTKGTIISHISEKYALVTAQAGENWHEFVLWCIENDLGGLENLSLIPGNVGTSPIQNIGAYGVEVKDSITEVQAIEIATGKVKIFQNEDCNFGYRNSIFKNSLKGKFIITEVTFKLTRTAHQLNYSYGAIQTELEKSKETPSIANISKAVIAIRNSKLPDPKKIGNSGSFFKNPVIPITHYHNLIGRYPAMPSYPISESEIKIPAGWLIENAGFKGKVIGNTGSHKNQALVLVNYGNATGQEIYDLAQVIQQTIQENYGIELEIEVNVI